MNKEEQPTLSIDSFSTTTWRLKNGTLHRLDGPAIIYPNRDVSWRIHGKPIHHTSLELSIGQSIPWTRQQDSPIALVIKQINHTLFQILLGNKKEYLFSIFYTNDTSTLSMSIPSDF